MVVRRLTFWLEDIPVALHDSYFPAVLVAGTSIEHPELIRGGAHAVIEDPLVLFAGISRVRLTRFRAGCLRRTRRGH